VAICGKKNLIRFLANFFPKKKGIRAEYSFFKIFSQIGENSRSKKREKKKKKKKKL
jgi:hypothetical protein